jgi:pimeloyl-ACP methyl ester carboxylesterase
MPKRLPRARTLKGEPKLAHYDSGTEVSGEPPIVLLHQSLARSEDWENIFPRLATRYRTIAYDARGHGRSGRSPDYSLRAFADDALRILREIAKEPAVLIGHSLGALVALVTAGDAPELVRGLVLEDPALGYPKAWDAAQYAALREGIASAEPVALAKAVSKQPLPSPGPRGERTYGELRGFFAAERVVTYFRDVDPAFIDARVAGDGPAAALITDALAKVKAPVLVLAGEPRLGGAVDDPAEWRLKKLPDVTVKRFPGSGHLLHGFRPEQFIENIEPFLRKLREGT